MFADAAASSVIRKTCSSTCATPSRHR